MGSFFVAFPVNTARICPSAYKATALCLLLPIFRCSCVRKTQASIDVQTRTRRKQRNRARRLMCFFTIAVPIVMSSALAAKPVTALSSPVPTARMASLVEQAVPVFKDPAAGNAKIVINPCCYHCGSFVRCSGIKCTKWARPSRRPCFKRLQ
jgi:hypothetical protein